MAIGDAQFSEAGSIMRGGGGGGGLPAVLRILDYMTIPIFNRINWTYNTV